MRLCEIYKSLNGESSLQGIPTVLVRTWGCNLNCIYCDTKFAREGKPHIFSPDSILTKISSFGLKNVLITGGEPLLQEEMPGLLLKLKKRGFSISIETNGSLDISVTGKNTKRVIDIKCPDSGESDSFLEKNLEYLQARDDVKFVISSENDYSYAKNFIITRLGCFRGELILSPALPCLEPCTLAEWILRDNLAVRFQVQLHKILWGNERKR